MRSQNMGKQKKRAVHSAKECAFLAVFVALVIAVQLCFAAIPGVELVTVLFLAYAYVMGAKRGMLAATVFTLLRQFLFGFNPVVFCLYTVYFNGFALLFGTLGRKWKNSIRALPYLVVFACICTACFTLLDNLLTPLWYAFSKRAFKVYFLASLSVMLPQVLCTAISVFILFIPLQKVFLQAKRSL